MSRIKILTDSTADLGAALAAAYDVTVIPLLVQFGEETYLDGVNMDNRRLFQLVEEKKQLPKSASPSPAVFREAFAKATADGSQVIYVGLSSKLSATHQNARLAAETFPPGQVYVFDSLNLSTGIGLQVLYACDLVRQGRSAEEILRALEEARPKVRTSFMIDTLEYMHKGGRCSGVQALMGTLLRIRPVIAVVDGGMIVDAKIRGPRHRGLDYMLDKFAAHARAGEVRPERVFITHTTTRDEVEFVKQRVREIMPDVKEVLDTDAGSVISTHCGPGTIGVLYMLK